MNKVKKILTDYQATLVEEIKWMCDIAPMYSLENDEAQESERYFNLYYNLEERTCELQLPTYEQPIAPEEFPSIYDEELLGVEFDEEEFNRCVDTVTDSLRQYLELIEEEYVEDNDRDNIFNAFEALVAEVTGRFNTELIIPPELIREFAHEFGDDIELDGERRLPTKEDLLKYLLVLAEDYGYYSTLSLLEQDKTPAENVQKIRHYSKLSQEAFSKKYKIPKRTIENWENNTRTPPQYVLELLEKAVCMDLLWADRTWPSADK